MTGNCLLIGNGLNQCLKGGLPWGDLLKDIAKEYDVDYNAEIAMPMEFERIVNNALKQADTPSETIYTDIKEKVAGKMLSAHLSEDAPHNSLVGLPIDSIITTNYDYLLEEAFDAGFLPKTAPKNVSKSLSASYTVGGIDFYHAHGEAGKCGTICLGYDHYFTIAKDISESIARKKDNRTQYIVHKLRGEVPFDDCWAEKFFTSNIAIIGLGLYECEYDLWWLLTHRASLINTNYADCRSLIDNTIVYCDVVDDEKELASRNKYSLLEGMNVKVRTFSLKEFGDYKTAYLHILEEIRAHGIG